MNCIQILNTFFVIFALNVVFGCSNTSNENDSVLIPEVKEPVAAINKGRATLDSLNALIIDNPNDLDVFCKWIDITR